MKNRLKRIMTLVLILSMAMSFAACGAEEAKAPEESETPDAEQTAADGEKVYTVSLVELPENMTKASKVETDGGELFIAGYSNDRQILLYSKNLADGTYKKYELEEPGEDESMDLIAFTPSGDRVYAVYDIMRMVNEFPEFDTMIAAFDRESCELLENAEIEGIEMPSFGGIFAVGDLIAGISYDGLMTLSPDGTVPAHSDNHSIESILKADGKLYAQDISDDYKTGTLYEITDGSCTLKKVCDIKDTKFDLSGEHPWIEVASCASENGGYIVTQDSVSKLNTETGEVEPLFTWKDIGYEFAGTPGSTAVSSDGKIFITDAYTGMLCEVSKQDKVEKKTLLVSCAEGVGTTYFSEAVSRFNLTNPEYRVEVKMYPYDNPALVLTELASGEFPDVFYIGSSVDRESVFKHIMVNDSLFEDLMPYIDNDDTISRESFAPGILESAGRDGHLYGMPVSVGFSNITVPKDLADSMEDWSVDALLQMNSELPDDVSLFYSNTSESILDSIKGFISTEYVDFSEGTCNFEDSDFGKWLQLCKEGAKETAESYVFYSGQGAHNVPRFFREDHNNDDYVYMGFPGADGPRTVLINTSGNFSIPKASENKEAAWEFIKILLSPALQNGTIGSFGYPVMKSALENNLLNKRYAAVPDTVEIDAKRSEEAFAQCSSMQRGSIVDDIINEEAAKYFADQSSLEDTVKSIQSRAGIYLAEQK